MRFRDDGTTDGEGVIKDCLALAHARCQDMVVEKCDVPQTMRRLCGPFDGDGCVGTGGWGGQGGALAKDNSVRGVQGDRTHMRTINQRAQLIRDRPEMHCSGLTLDAVRVRKWDIPTIAGCHWRSYSCGICVNTRGRISNKVTT